MKVSFKGKAHERLSTRMCKYSGPKQEKLLVKDLVGPGLTKIMGGKRISNLKCKAKN